MCILLQVQIYKPRGPGRIAQLLRNVILLGHKPDWLHVTWMCVLMVRLCLNVPHWWVEIQDTT